MFDEQIEKLETLEKESVTLIEAHKLLIKEEKAKVSKLRKAIKQLKNLEIEDEEVEDDDSTISE